MLIAIIGFVTRDNTAMVTGTTEENDIHRHYLH